VVIVDAGVALQRGPPDRVFSSPRNARVADLVGIQNHFRGRFLRGAGDIGLLRWEDGSGATLDLQVIDKHRLDDGVAVTWVLAGEHVDVLAADPPPAPGAVNGVRCELAEVLALGETSLCTLVPERLPGERLTLNLSTAQLRQLEAGVGKKLLVQIPMQGIHIMPQRTGG
jgi:molybdate transport system ATP-binding protein